METELGFPLLIRSNKGISLTNEGQRVYDDCIELLSFYDNCSQRWNEMAYHYGKSIHEETFNVYALPMLCNNVLNQAIYFLSEKYPHIHIAVHERQLDSILDSSLQNPKSIVLSHFNEKTMPSIFIFARENNRNVRTLISDEYRFFVSSSSPLFDKVISENELKDFVFASYSNMQTGHDKRFIDNGLVVDENKFGRTMLLSNYHSMIEAAISSDNVITLLADRITTGNPYRTNGMLQPLDVEGFHLPMTYYLMTSKDASPAEQVIRDGLTTFFLQQFPQNNL